MGDFSEVFGHLHSKYKKYPHSVIYYLNATVVAYSKILDSFAKLVELFDNSMVTILWETYF